jgi:hypothetical protein
VRNALFSPVFSGIPVSKGRDYLSMLSGFPARLLSVSAKRECLFMNKERSARLTAVLLAVAIGACAYGAARGEMNTVFLKSVNICLECIGIG